MVTTFNRQMTPADHGSRYRVQGKPAPRWCASVSVQANSSWSRVACAFFVFLVCLNLPAQAAEPKVAADTPFTELGAPLTSFDDLSKESAAKVSKTVVRWSEQAHLAKAPENRAKAASAVANICDYAKRSGSKSLITACATAAKGLFASPDSEVRRMGAIGLGSVGVEPFHRAELGRRLNDPDDEVRIEVARSLGKIGDNESIEAMVKAIKNPKSTGELQLECVKSIGSIGGSKASLELHDLSKVNWGEFESMTDEINRQIDRINGND